MARPPSSGGPGPRPPLGGNGSGSGRAAAPGNGTAGKKRSSPAGPALGQRCGRCEPRGGFCWAPLCRAAGALCSRPAATANVVLFVLRASGKRRFLILVESSISPGRKAAWPAPSCLASQRIAQERSEPGASPRCAERCVRSARWMRNEQVHGSIRSSCPLFRHCRSVYLLALLCSRDKPQSSLDPPALRLQHSFRVGSNWCPARCEGTSAR